MVIQNLLLLGNLTILFCKKYIILKPKFVGDVSMGVSIKNLGVSIEKMGDSNENMESQIKICGLK